MGRSPSMRRRRVGCGGFPGSTPPATACRLSDLGENGNGTFRTPHGIDSWQSTNPATTGCPLAARDCRTPQPCKPRGEWRAIRMGDASSLALSLSKGRVGTGDETPLPRRRQSDEKVPSPFPGKTLGTRPRSGCLNLHCRELCRNHQSPDRNHDPDCNRCDGRARRPCAPPGNPS